MGAEKLAADTNVHVIQVPNMLDKNAVAAFEKNTAQWLLNPALLHVFDFKDALTLEASFYRVIAVYRRTLTKNQKFFASLNVRPDLLREIVDMGLTQVFNVVESMDKAKESAGMGASKPKLKIDLNILKPFIEGTINTLKVQANLPVTTGKPYLSTAPEENIAIAGIISTNSAEMPGSIALSFPAAVFLGIYENMVGEKQTAITDEIKDAAGELLNIIYGHAKTKLKADGVSVDMAIPVVLTGEKLKMQIGERGKSMTIPCQCQFGTFFLEVHFKKMQV